MMGMHSAGVLAAAALCIAACACLGGCGRDDALPGPDMADLVTEESGTTTAATTTLPETTTTTTSTTQTTTTTTTTTTTVTTTAATTTTTEITLGEISSVTTAAERHWQGVDGFSDAYNAFLQDTVFVGDSICSGLRVYHILPDDNCVAKGCVGARNIFDYTFPVRGNEFYVRYALTVLKPKYIVFSMGMNDVNMTSPDTFCENYELLLEAVHELLPDTKLFIASVTPVTNETDFTSNAKIDALNAALRNADWGVNCKYVDISSMLKSWNTDEPALNSGYDGGDGIHLAPEAYRVILRAVCEQLVDTGCVGGISSDGVAYGYAAD